MFSWLKRLIGPRPPEPHPSVPDQDPEPIPHGNPAKGVSMRLAVAGPAGQREEEIDLAQTLSWVFAELGRTHTLNRAVLIDCQSEIEFRPGIVSFQPKDDLSMSMCTTIEIAHPGRFHR